MSVELWKVGAVALVAVLIGAVLFLLMRPTPEQAIHALRASGFSDPRITDTDYALSGLYCGKGDAAAFHASAINARGEPVQVVVCCGVVKSCTVRVP